MPLACSCRSTKGAVAPNVSLQSMPDCLPATGRPRSSYISATAAKASWAFARASARVSPSVMSSGSNGEVTVYPPSGWGSKTRGIFAIILGSTTLRCVLEDKAHCTIGYVSRTTERPGALSPGRDGAGILAAHSHPPGATPSPQPSPKGEGTRRRSDGRPSAGQGSSHHGRGHRHRPGGVPALR